MKLPFPFETWLLCPMSDVQFDLRAEEKERGLWKGGPVAPTS